MNLQIHCVCGLDPMRQGDGLTPEIVAGLMAAVLVLPLVAVSIVVVARVFRRRHRRKQQLLQQLRLQTHRQSAAALQSHETAARLTSGASAVERPRE